MIGRLTGRVVEREVSDSSCILDVHGVGYEVFVPLRSLSKLPSPPDEATVHVHTHVREEAFTLFGFANLEDRAVFRVLLGVSGVGPKLAMTILADLTASELARAVAEGNKKRFESISGVGKKLAARLALELKDKVALPEAFEDAHTRQTVAAPAIASPLPSVAEEVVQALTSLGFPRARAETAASQVVKEGDERPLETLLRLALASLG